ncbi:amp dependent CoA ligase [Obba rivulosa]|uniref:Amp dependent CoA ligase n=1 Tax=Obba rivulosa TaxID=1052685 RepID=A0A8E2DRY1_9APHY|nr:amp dependent CoA ligase [Obba rivulosa]
MEFQGPGGPLPYIPDDLTVVQFILDSHHPTRPVVNGLWPWMIEDATGRKIGGDEIRARTSGLANALSANWNIREDDVVCIFSTNHVDYPVAIWAIHRLGAIATGANPSYTQDELEYQLSITKSKAIIVHSEIYPVALAAARKVGISPERILFIDSKPKTTSSPHFAIGDFIADGLARPPSFIERRLQPGEAKEKLAFLSLSSGTTGRPKATLIPHYALIANVIQIAVCNRTNVKNISPDMQRYHVGEVGISGLPLYHIYGLVLNLHFLLFSGITLVMIPKFNFVEMLQSIQRYRINHLSIVPPMVVLLCKHPAVKDFDLSSVKTVVSAAAPLSAEITLHLSKVLPMATIGQGYGLTETCTALAFPEIGPRIATPGCAGILMSGVTARIVKADGSLAGFGEAGQLVVTGPSMAIGYLDNDQATKETFVNGYDSMCSMMIGAEHPPSWVYTGDEVIINQKYEVFVVDRIKELIKVKGFQVAPAELEGHLLDHPDVGDVCVVPIPDEYSGELPYAFVVLSGDAQQRVKKYPAEAVKIKEALCKRVSDTKIAYKHLAGVEFIEAIPKNPSGKLLRRVLRDQAKQMLAQGKLKFADKAPRAKL